MPFCTSLVCKIRQICVTDLHAPYAPIYLTYMETEVKYMIRTSRKCNMISITPSIDRLWRRHGIDRQRFLSQHGKSNQPRGLKQLSNAYLLSLWMDTNVIPASDVPHPSATRSEYVSHTVHPESIYTLWTRPSIAQYIRKASPLQLRWYKFYILNQNHHPSAVCPKSYGLSRYELPVDSGESLASWIHLSSCHWSLRCH